MHASANGAPRDGNQRLRAAVHWLLPVSRSRVARKIFACRSASSSSMFEHFRLHRLLAFDQGAVLLRAAIDAHLQCSNHTQLGRLVHQRLLARLAAATLGLLLGLLVAQLLERLLQRRQGFLERRDHILFQRLGDHVDLRAVQPLGDALHVVARLLDRLGEGHAACRPRGAARARGRPREQ